MNIANVICKMNKTRLIRQDGVYELKSGLLTVPKYFLIRNPRKKRKGYFKVIINIAYFVFFMLIIQCCVNDN